MKVKLLSLLVPALLILTTANAAEVYHKDESRLSILGNINSLHYLSNSDAINSNQTHMRIGFKGETKVNNQLTGYGQWEYQIQDSTNEKENNFYTSLAFVGLRFGDNSSFDYGRNNSVIHDVTSWTNVLPEFSSNVYASKNFIQQHGDGFATYRNRDFFGLVNGLNFAIQYQGRNDSVNREHGINNTNYDEFKQQINGFAGSLTYNLGENLSVGGAFSNARRANSQNDIEFDTSDHAKTYAGGLKYDANNIYLATQYIQTYNTAMAGNLGLANKAQNFKAVMQYKFDFGLNPSVAYLQSKGKNLDNGYGDQDILKYVDIGSIYHFNKNISTYVDYKINLLDKNDFTDQAGISTDDTVTMGLVYKF